MGKRIYCLLLVAVFAFTMILAGCGNTAATTDTASTTAAPAVTTAAPAATTAAASSVSEASKLPKVDLTWYMRGKGPEKDGDMVYAEASKYTLEKINATIKILPVDRGSFNQKVTAAIAAGEVFDMTFTASYAANYVQNAQRGAFVALNDPNNNLFDKYAPKTKEILGPEFLSASQINGLNYAIPVNKEKAHSYGYVFRKDMVDKYKFDLSKVKTLEDFEPMLKTIKENEPNMPYPISECTRDNSQCILDWDRSAIDANLPVSMYQDGRDGKFHLDLETPEEMAYFKTMRKYYLAGYIRKDAPTVGDYNPDLQAGKIFAKEITTIPGADKQMSNAYGQEWVMVEMTTPSMSNGETMGAMNAISRTSKNPERAMMFQELMNTDKYLNNLINFGIEGKHYVKKGENIIDYMPDSDNGKNSTYNPQYSWGFANQFLTYLFPNEDPNKWKNYEDYNNRSIKAPTLGFLMNTDPVKNEIAACMNVAAEFMPALETGASDPDTTVPKAIAKFKEAGVDKVIAEAQKQYDAWKATKK